MKLLALTVVAFLSLGCSQDHATRAYTLRATFNEVLQDSHALHDAQVIDSESFGSIVLAGELITPMLDELDRIADLEAAASASGQPMDQTQAAFNFEKCWNEVRPKVLALVVKIAVQHRQQNKSAMLWPGSRQAYAVAA